MKKIQYLVVSLFIASLILALTHNAEAFPPFLGKARKFGAKDCTFCHVDPLGGPPWNERGKWLVKEKERRNADAVNVDWLAEYPADAKKGDAPAADKPAAKIDPKVYDAYVGDYEAEGRVLHVTKENDRLYGTPENGDKKELLPEAENKFKVADVNATLVFVKDENGKVTGLELELNGQPIKAKKIK